MLRIEALHTVMREINFVPVVRPLLGMQAGSDLAELGALVLLGYS